METEPPGRLLQRELPYPLELLCIECSAFEGKMKAFAFLLNEVSFFFRFLRSYTVVDIGDDEREVEGLATGI